MKTLQKGFTLIELMIVVAIVGILAAIALPAYQDYMVRSKLSESLAKLDEMKLSIAEYVASNNAAPPNGTQAGMGGNGAQDAGSTTTPATAKFYGGIGYQYVNDANVRVGVRQNSAAHTLLDNTVWLVMDGAIDSPNSTAVLWTCGTNLAATSPLMKYLPSNCRNTVAFAPN